MRIAFALATSLALPLAAQDPPEQPSPAIPDIRIPGMRSLTISGQYRLRYEYMRNFDFNRNNGADNDFFTQRIRLNFEPEFTETISGFVQIQDAREWGEETSTLDDDADGLDIHQGFVRVEDVPWVGGAAKAGRQTVALGDQRLISSLEWTSQGRTFDGYRHTWNVTESADLDALFLQTREIKNATNDDAFLAGLYGSGHPGDNTDADLYVLFLNDDETTAGGNHHRITLGTRVVQTFGNLELGAEVATQFGEIDGADIPIGETFALHTHATLRCPTNEFDPYLRAEFNYASGDDPSSGDNERFNTLFPFAHAYHGYMDFALWENLMHFQVELGAKPCEGSRTSVAWHYFRAPEETDRFGGPNGLLSPGIAGQSQTMGNEIDVRFIRTLDTAPLKTDLEVGYGVFLPGPGTEQAQGSDDVAHFVYAQSGFRF